MTARLCMSLELAVFFDLFPVKRETWRNKFYLQKKKMLKYSLKNAQVILLATWQIKFWVENFMWEYRVKINIK